jgi:hypothetical protein
VAMPQFTQLPLAEQEAWRPIPGWEGTYEVSNLGRVRAVRFRNKQSWRVLDEPRVLRDWPHDRTGHRRVSLCRDGTRRDRDIHQLVLLTFVGPCPPGHEGAHLDGNPRNNRLSNLAWATHAENESHKRLHGTASVPPPPRCCGERNGAAKLREEDIPAIRASAETSTVMARRYDVDHSLICRIRRREAWRHVE